MTNRQGASNGVESLNKGMVQIPGRMEPDRVRFHDVTQNSEHLKCMNCLFLEFSISSFCTVVDRGHQTVESKTIGKTVPLYKYLTRSSSGLHIGIFPVLLLNIHLGSSCYGPVPLRFILLPYTRGGKHKARGLNPALHLVLCGPGPGTLFLPGSSAELLAPS